MFIDKATILTLPAEGTLTLQIPTLLCYCTIDMSKMTLGSSIGQGSNFPDNYFCTLKGSNTKPYGCDVPTNNGFMYLTSIGYKAFKKDIKAAFTGPWKDFENYAVDHFARVQTQLNKLMNKERAMILLHTQNNEPRKLKHAQNRLAFYQGFVV
jgi:hypothetical protein